MWPALDICGLRACLHGVEGPQTGEATCGGSPYLSCKRDQTLNERLYGHTGYLTYLDPDVEKVEYIIQRINHYLLDNAIGFPNTYPLVVCVAGGIVWMRD